jgi:murein DD-endopeptidase MepM/ murein hydrolase activator NlpD
MKNKYWLIGTLVGLLITVLQPVNQVAEALVHFRYAEVGGIAIAMPLNHETETAVETIEPQPDTTDQHKDQSMSFDLTDPQIGMMIAGYRVSSLQGPRLHPVHNVWRNHNGLDLATPAATPLFAPGKIEVTCHYDSGGGGGYYAQFLFRDMLWQTLHLTKNTCVAGGHELGWQFAQTGNSGVGTNAHLHLQLRHPTERWFIKVKKGHAEAILIQQGGN